MPSSVPPEQAEPTGPDRGAAAAGAQASPEDAGSTVDGPAAGSEPAEAEATAGTPAEEPVAAVAEPAAAEPEAVAAEPAGSEAVASEPSEPEAVAAEPSEPEAASEPGPTAGSRSRRRMLTRVLLVMLIVLAVAGAGTVAGAKILISRYTGNIKQEHLLGESGVQRQRTKLMTVQGPINILLVGVDARGNPGEVVRADSIIILHVPATHDRAYLVSLPRDADVRIPAYAPANFSGARAKINSAFGYGSQNGRGWSGGFQLLAATITQLSGIRFNAGAIINFDGFRAVVNALGGVRMCVDEKTTSIHHGKDRNGDFAVPFRMSPSGQLIPKPGVTPDTYYPGCQQMNGFRALDYVRQRELIPDGDYGRARHQQQFLKAMLSKANGAGLLSNPGRLDAVVRAAGAALTVDTGGVSFEDWAYTLRDITSSRLVLVKTNGGQFQSFWVGGELRERLTPDSLEMLRSIRTNRLDAFLASHPTWGDSPAVAPTGAQPG